MKMTLEFNSLEEAREWAAELLRLTTPVLTVIEEAQPPPPVEREPEPEPEPPVKWDDLFAVLGDRAKGLGKRQRDVVTHLYGCPHHESKVSDVAHDLGMKSTIVSGALSALCKDRGLTEKVSRGVWRLVINAPEPTPEPTPEPEPDPTPEPVIKAVSNIDDLLNGMDL